MPKKPIFLLKKKKASIQKRGYDNRKLTQNQLDMAKFLLFGSYDGNVGDKLYMQY